MFIIGLTIIIFLDVFADKDHVSLKLSLVNVPGLNFLLRSKIFVSEDNQLWVAHLIQGYEPLLHIYQDVGQALRTGNSSLARIDVSKSGFLAKRDLPPMVFPAQQNPPQFAIPLQQVPFIAVAVAEEIASSSRLSLKEEIDRFRFAEEERTPEKPVELSYFETESNKLSTAHQPKQTIALVETSSEEVENMDLKKRPSLRGLIANRNNEATSPEVPKAQTSANLPLPPPPPSPPPADLGPRVNLDLKKKRPPQELEEGRCSCRGAPNNKRPKTLETRRLNPWIAEMTPRYADSSVHGLP